MSATNRGLRERLVDDAYSTPGWCVRSILTAMNGSESFPMPVIPRGPGLWMEPCAGDGAIIRAVQGFFIDSARAEDGKPSGPVGPAWIAIEKRSACRRALKKFPNVSASIGDFLKFKPDNGFPVGENGVPELDLLITNPPFSLAMEFIEHSRKIFPGTLLCFLLRLNFLESQKRSAFFQTAMPDVYVLPRRPSFTNDGGVDATGYCWVVFRPALEGSRKYGNVSVLPLESCRP